MSAENPTPPRGKLTDEQVANWRKVMCSVLGPWALIMPREDVERLRDKMQALCNAEAKP